MSLVEILPHDALGYLGAPPRLRIVDQLPAREHAMSEHDGGVLEHDDIHRVGAETTAGVTVRSSRLRQRASASSPSRRTTARSTSERVLALPAAREPKT